MPPTDRNNADERRARIESLLKDLRASRALQPAGVGAQKRASRKLVRPAKAQIASSRRSRAGKKR